MGIALLGLADLFMPLHSLAIRWMPGRRKRSSALRYVGVLPSCAAHAAAAATDRPTARPLRVVHTVDARASGRGTGRVVISGRMADVCAELDRLAALEATQRPPHADPLH